MKLNILFSNLFFLILLFVLLSTPTFADSLDCSKCSINQQCFCELKLDGGVCTSGLWVVLKSEGNPLQIPVIAGIPPAKVSFTPTGTGKIKVMGFCFSTSIPVILKKEIEITNSFLQCPTTCKIGASCTCTVTNCTDGLYVMINKINNPVDYSVYSPVSNIKTDPYTNTFKAKENGTIGIVAVCFSPLPPKSATANIIIGGEDSKCHIPHEDPSWLPQNDYEVKVLEKGCTDSCGTEYKIEIRRGTNCGKQLWVWSDLGDSVSLDIGKCYLVKINTGGGCGHTIANKLSGEVTCPECDNCHTHEDPTWIADNHKLKIIQKGCTANNGCSEGATPSTEYLVEIRDSTNCGKQLWLWLDNTRTQNQPVIGKCYESYIMKYTNNCNAYVIRYLQNEIACPECSAATCGDLGGFCCDPSICIQGKISGASDCSECCPTLGLCQALPCKVNQDCDDANPCTQNLCSAGQCNYIPITTCVSNDGCCPSGCTYPNDNDCGGSNDCSIVMNFDKQIYCEGDSLNMTLEFRKNNILTDPSVFKVLLDNPWMTNWDLTSYYNETAGTGIYYDENHRWGAPGTRTYKITATIGGCSASKIHTLNVLSKTDPQCQASPQTCAQLNGVCCDPSICVTGKISGASDCIECCTSLSGCQVNPFCGDNNCDSGECSSGCTQDCSITDCCGIEQCNTAIGEDCSTCSGDCGTCPTCTDSDGGNDYYTEGFVTGTYNGATYTYYDDCGTSIMHERYCDGTRAKINEYVCPDGCDDSATNKNICKPISDIIKATFYVRDNSGNPLSGAEVGVVDPDTSDWLGQCTTASTGKCIISGIKKDRTHQYQVDKTGYTSGIGSLNINKDTIITVILTKKPAVCTILSASITTWCSPGDSSVCEEGEGIEFTVTYAGDCPYDNEMYIQVDANSTDGLCDIQYTGGDMSGMYPLNKGTTGKIWRIPTIPAQCKGKIMSATNIALWKNGRPGDNGAVWVAGSTISGMFEFAGKTICTDSDSHLGFPDWLAVKGVCKDSTGTYTDSCPDSSGMVREWYCGPTSASPEDRSCLGSDTTVGCLANGFGACVDGACDAKPDLVISDISWTPINPKINEKIEVTVYVKNIGTAYAGTTEGNHVWMRFEIPILGQDVGAGTNGGLNPDQTKNRVFGVVGTPNIIFSTSGQYQIKVVADPFKSIEESNENNNERIETINITQPLCSCSGTGYETHTIGSDTVYVDCNTDKCWTSTPDLLYNWEGAYNYCYNLDYGGFTDWVLPDLTTLENLCSSCFGTCFGKEGYSSDYWSSIESNSDDANSLLFYTCNQRTGSKSIEVFVRCVRG